MPRPRRRSEYRTQLHLQSCTGSTAVDNYGHRTKSWVTLDTVWASVDQLRGMEAVAVHGRWPQATYRIETDYDARINEKRRFVNANSTMERYSIMDVENWEGRNRTMFVTAERLKST